MEITVDVELTCSNCGRALEAKQGRGGSLEVEPCEHCADAEYGRGYSEGEADAADAYTEPETEEN